MGMYGDLKSLNQKDLTRIDLIIKGISEPISLSDLERYDDMIELLGLDKDRAIYFNNSRNLLPEEDKQNCFKVHKVTSNRFTYTLPADVCSIK